MPEKVVIETVESAIHIVRGHRVMTDADLARFYGVATKVLNQALRRNKHRFPEDFAFQLTASEFENLRSQNVTSSLGAHGGRRFLPWVFTEHGAVMAASILNSAVAIAASVEIVRAFVRMSKTLSGSELITKLVEIEHRLKGHDEDLAAVFRAIKQLIETPKKGGKEIGFHTLKEDETRTDSAKLPRRDVRYAAPRRARTKTTR
jgi:ORF6N domain